MTIFTCNAGSDMPLNLHLPGAGITRTCPLPLWRVPISRRCIFPGAQAAVTKVAMTFLRPVLSKSTVSLLPSVKATLP